MRGIDNSEINSDRTVVVTIGNQSITATIVDDDQPPPSADFSSDGHVNGTDFLAWQRGFGLTESAARSDGDANHDGAVNSLDLQTWQEQFGNITLTGDFDNNNRVDGADFLHWQRDGDLNNNIASLPSWSDSYGSLEGTSQDVVASPAATVVEALTSHVELTALAAASTEARDHMDQPRYREFWAGASGSHLLPGLQATTGWNRRAEVVDEFLGSTDFWNSFPQKSRRREWFELDRRTSKQPEAMDKTLVPDEFWDKPLATEIL